MSRFVQRDDQGAIVGSYANLQPKYAEEEVADDAPDLLAYINPPPTPPARDPLAARLAAVEAVLIDKGTLRKQDVDDKVEAAAVVAEVDVVK